MPIKINTISTLKKELHNLPREVLIEHCLRIAKYKKDNKELLNYLLFESDDEHAYIQQIKNEVEQEFTTINTNTFYYIKKSIRRIHRIVTKYIRHSGKKETQVELLIFFCQQMRACGISFRDSKVMVNLYERQLKAIHKALSALHEDIRIDYESELEEVDQPLR
ncbi:MAG: hypothetical protein JEZ14_01550 [Marinilabiliaceae bacterium]|nr:hypothetical protein [Marinilabiliaceae bacterium]